MTTEQFITNVGIISHDPTIFKSPLKLIAKLTDKKMSDDDWLPFDWKKQAKLNRKAIKFKAIAFNVS